MVQPKLKPVFIQNDGITSGGLIYYAMASTPILYNFLKTKLGWGLVLGSASYMDVRPALVAPLSIQLPAYGLERSRDGSRPWALAPMWEICGKILLPGFRSAQLW